MDQINVQRWANSLRRFYPNHSKSSLLPNPYEDDQNGLRNPSTMIKTTENESLRDVCMRKITKKLINLDFPSSEKNSYRTLIKSELHRFDKIMNDEENLDFQSNAQLYDNEISNFLVPLSNHHDADALSDAGTYIIEDETDIQEDYEPEQKTNTLSSIKKNQNQTKYLHETFYMDRLGFSATPMINRPIIDLNVQTNSYDSPLLSQTSVGNNSHHSIRNELEDKPYNCLIPSSTVQYQQKPVILPKMKIKPAECFVISPTLEIKPFPTKNTLRQKIENSQKSKLEGSSASIKHLTIKAANSQLISSNQNSMENYLFKPQKPLYSSSQSYNQYQTTIYDQICSSDLFQHKSIVDKTTPVNVHYEQQTFSSDTIDPNQSNNTKIDVIKFSIDKLCILDHKKSIPSSFASKYSQKQILLKISPGKNSKPTTTLSSSVIHPSRQMNRTVHLRRAHAKAKIEELSQITTKQLYESDIMSASCSYSPSSHSKKEPAHLQLHVQPKARKSVKLQLQDMLGTRTILPSLDQQVLPASSKQHEAPLFTCRKTVISTVNDEEQYKTLSTSEYSLKEKQYDLLRENGKRLANKLVQLSASILSKLQLNESATDDHDDVQVHQLEQLIDKLAMVNRALTSIDTSLARPTNTDLSI
ncbi:unnamed protein product [Rotaria socialis]|uniref:Uncharacterized protein n=1 Tax=Rotaria socialis TaxID=392032 RepID=A0A818MLG6_9BILA|nr:unnamed protein product [Rotaria socialis]